MYKNAYHIHAGFFVKSFFFIILFIDTAIGNKRPWRQKRFTGCLPYTTSPIETVSTRGQRVVNTICINISIYRRRQSEALKIESCHDANFAVTDTTDVKVGIMAIIGFLWPYPNTIVILILWKNNFVVIPFLSDYCKFCILCESTACATVSYHVQYLCIYDIISYMI